jgi:putative membrane protein insertion efficiency factor
MTEEHTEHKNQERLKDLPLNIKNFPRWVLLVFIRGYQLLISPLLPPDTCRFYPSCSHYTFQAIYRFGIFRGTAMGIWRVLRCNPFNPGGFDPVPLKLDSHHLKHVKK